MTALVVAFAAGLAASPAGAGEQAAQVFRQTAPSVFSVLAQISSDSMSQGSAVVVGPGLLVTNYHVVQNSQQVRVTQGGIEHTATVEATDPAHDVALLRATDVDAPAVAFGRSDEVRVGDTVYAIGSPRGLELSLSEGIVAALRTSSDHDDGRLIQTTAPVSPGSSGGGLFDASARLVGLVSAQALEGQNLNFAVPVEWLRRVGVEVQPAAAAAPETAPVAQAAVPAQPAPAARVLRVPDTRAPRARRTLWIVSVVIVVLLLLAKPMARWLANGFGAIASTERGHAVADPKAHAPDRLAPFRQAARAELAKPEARDPKIWTEALRQTGKVEVRALAAYVELRAQALYREELDRRWNKAQAQHHSGR
ncbi:MAG TPA: serine protease [Solimonas sp.]|nr:serine protease [Solimonas sp.]